MAKTSKKIHNICETFAKQITKWTGNTITFILVSVLILIWLLVGPFFNFSDTWQLYANTSTSIITFLIVFLIQRTQNKEQIAIHLKLNELLAAHQGTSNRLLNVEDLSEEEIEKLRKAYHTLATKASHDSSKTTSHTIEEID